MAVANNQPMTLEEYLDYDDGTDARYELVDGILTEMGAESTLNIDIAIFLIVMFARLMPTSYIHRGTEIEVGGGKANTRYPDLMVLTEDSAAALSGKKRALITLDMPVPALVVEVVSSSATDPRSRERDYVDKRREYAQRGIPEYWIVDPMASVVWVLKLVGQAYQEQQFTRDEHLISPRFPTLELRASQVLRAEL